MTDGSDSSEHRRESHNPAQQSSPLPRSASARLEEMNVRALEGAGAERIQRQHAAGKLTARERIDALVDPGTFVEAGRFVTHRSTDFGMEHQKVLGDGVITGHGLVEERALSPGEQASEALLMGLRLGEGVDLASLAARLGLRPEVLIDADKARFYGDLGLVARDGTRLTVTPQGMPLLDALLGELVPVDLVSV